MARRIAGVGRVTVSLRRSTAVVALFASFLDSYISLPRLLPLCFLVSATLSQQFHEGLIRNGELGGVQANRIAIAFNQAAVQQFIYARAQVRGIVTLNSCEVDSGKLTQAQKQFLLERLRGGDGFFAFDCRAPLCDCSSIRGRIVDIRPAPLPVKRMRARAETDVWLAAPIFQIVRRGASGERPIGDFVMLESRGRQRCARD